MQFDDFWQDLKRLRAARGRQAANLIAWRTTPSTHLTARRLVSEYGSEESSPPPVDIVALEQSAGHGREGRPWSSPSAGGVYTSLVRVLTAEQLPTLPLIVPVVLAGVLNEVVEGRCRIKWPNDLVVAGAKLGGILIDVSHQGDRHVAVISFGINVAPDTDLFEAPRATSLGALEVASAVERDSIATLFLRLTESLDRALQPGSEADASRGDVISRYRQLSAHELGESMRWRQDDQTVEGIFRGFDQDGCLKLEVAAEVRKISAGTLLESTDAPT